MNITHMMTRTSFYLPESLHRRLHTVSKQQRKSVSQLAVELLDEALRQEEAQKLDETYQALLKIKGVVKEDIPTASSRIDDVLYGETGAWQGEPGEHGLWQVRDDTQLP